MDIRKLQRAIVDGLEDVKAQDIVVFNTEHLSPLFERVIIASGTSNRQTKALAASVRGEVKDAGFPVVATEGEDNGEWIIVDCGAAVVHVMQQPIREYYRLEEIWGGKPVKLKLGGPAKGLVKASEPMDDEDEPAPAKKPARKTAAKAEPAKKAVAQKVPAKKAASPMAAVARKKAAAQREINRIPAAKTVVVKKSSAKPAAKKVAAKTAPAKRAPARKAAKPRTA
ncbi:ribosome silencing factor [Ideonella sp. DXS22W]|uniref:Ribosomal silencing factor RsfS n=1 Tax=Pseudaquabacterium inlustre TaxID=2984192 RepID=A0ABU9CGH3_9BURK